MIDSKKPWPKSQSEVMTVVRRLREEGGHGLFAFLVAAAAGAEWRVFAMAMEQVCELRPQEVRGLLDRPEASPEWSGAYSTARLPAELFTFFVKVVLIGQSIARESPQIGPSRGLRAMVVKKALLASGVGAALSTALKAELTG